MPITFDRHCFHLCNDRVSYIIRLAAGKYPLHLYWGRRLRAVRDDLLSRRVSCTDDAFSLNETALDHLPQECPTFAGSDLREGMVHVFHENGTHALLLSSGRGAYGEISAILTPSALESAWQMDVVGWLRSLGDVWQE